MPRRAQAVQAERKFWPPLIAGDGPKPCDYYYRNRHGRWVKLGDVNDFGIAAIIKKFEPYTKWWYVVRDEGIRRGIIDVDGKVADKLNRLILAERPRAGRGSAAAAEPDFVHEE
jgi:hypothetical protein